MNFPFEFGEKVVIDKDENLKCIVTAFEYRDAAISVEVSYFINGEPKFFWLPLWRITKDV